MTLVRPLRDGEKGTASVLLAEVLNDKRIAILGKAPGWVDVVRALLNEYDGLILVAIEGDKMVGTAVYRVKDTRLNIDLALKEMTPQPGLDAGLLSQLRQQFQQEANILARLDHPTWWMSPTRSRRLETPTW